MNKETTTTLPTDLASTWPAVRAEALSRLASFATAGAANYAAVRNLDQGFANHSGVSRLSPWIRHRALLETEVIQRVVRQHSHTKTRKFVQEVFWRGYWKGWLQHRPAMWRQYKASLEQGYNEINSVSGALDTYHHAISATTPIALFNSWVHELTATGYLHNHSRMWFASIWIFTLRLPWQLGADFFYRHLLDGDAAANTLSWRWVAGLHTQGKVYAATQENILRNAAERGREYSAGLTTLALQPEPISEVPSWPTQPERLKLPNGQPPTDRPALLILHDDDLGYGHDFGSTVALALAMEPQPRGKLATSALVTDFSRKLLSEAVQQHPHDSAIPLDTRSIVEQVKRSGLKNVVTPMAPVGPTSDALENLCALLAKEKVCVTQIARPYDRLVWPHARKGFFALNKKIPSLLTSIVEERSQADWITDSIC